MDAWLRGEVAALATVVLLFGVPTAVCCFLYVVAALEGERPGAE